MSQQEKKWEDMLDKIREGSNFSILEEGVDIDVQRAFMQLRERLSIDPGQFKELCRESVENTELLFNPETETSVKKRMLAVLSSIDSIPVFRILERFAAESTPLKMWGIVALQQSRMLIQTSLTEGEPGVFISSGLGGNGRKLRYFCILPYAGGIEKTEHYQEKLLHDEIEFRIKKADGEIESIRIIEKYTELTVLLPIDTDLRSIFMEIISECNSFGNFMSERVIVTNVKKFSEREILDILDGN